MTIETYYMPIQKIELVEINIEAFQNASLSNTFHWGEKKWPILFHENPLLCTEEHYMKCAAYCLEHGATTLVISADEDHFFHRQLSPRNQNTDLHSRLTLLLLLIDRLASLNCQLAVAFTGEELCPGGLDITDGIFIAKTLTEKGIKTLLVSAGTKDFPALKWRKPTHQKAERVFLETNEPWLASGLWIKTSLSDSGVQVFAKGVAQDNEKAIQKSTELGLAGIVLPYSLSI